MKVRLKATTTQEMLCEYGIGIDLLSFGELYEVEADIKEHWRIIVGSQYFLVPKDWCEEVIEKTFEEIARSMMEYLNNHHHPHTKIIITPTTAEILEGIQFIPIEDYVKD